MLSVLYLSNTFVGAFLFGLIVPREGGLAITLTEKIEDIVSIVFLPTVRTTSFPSVPLSTSSFKYFTFSGLNTNLWLLDNSQLLQKSVRWIGADIASIGITWAFTIGVIALSFFGKFGGCTITSRLAGYGWRESSMIGALMSCKGFVSQHAYAFLPFTYFGSLLELIVLNVGLQAGVLSQRLFSMFVLEALTLTIVTTPLVTALYPPHRRTGAGETASPLEDGESGQPNDKELMLPEEQPWRHRLTVVLDKLDHIPGAMALTQLVLPPRSIPSDGVSSSSTETIGKLKMPRVSVEALRLINLSDRTSAMMKSTAADSLIRTDPMLGIFRMFGELNELAITTSLSVVPHDDFARSVAEHAHTHTSHLVLLPWSPTKTATTMNVPGAPVTTPKPVKSDYNPFDVLFGSISGVKADNFPSVIHSQFVREVFAQSKTDVALFVDTGDRSGVGLGGSVHIFLPFFGGPDDRLALEFVVQLCFNPRMTATVVRMVKQDGVDEAASLGDEPLARLPMARLGSWLDGPGGRTHCTERPPATSVRMFYIIP